MRYKAHKIVIWLLVILITDCCFMLSDALAETAKAAECALENYLPDSDDCWFCPLFKVLFNTASVVALKSYQTLADGVASVVIVGFALWVSIFVLKHVSALEVKTPSKMIQEFLIQTFRVLVVVIILKVSFFQVIQLTLEPVFNTGMNFTQAISEGSCPNNAPYMENIMGYGSDGYKASSSGGLPASMGQHIVCSIKTMQDSVSRLLAYGRQALCVAWKPKAIIKYVIPSFPYLITGLMLYVGGLILLLAFPWCLIDCIIQMSIAAGLAPAAIGAWAFKITSSYLGKIWNFFMNAMFNFVFLSIILYIIMTVVDQFMAPLTSRAFSTGKWEIFTDPINGLAYWGVTGLQLVIVCLMGWVFLDQGKFFADKFAKSAPIGGIGRSVGGAIAQGAKKTGKVAFQAGKSVGKFGMTVGDHLIGSKVRAVRNNYRVNKVKNKGNAITDDNGNIIGYERTRRNLLGQRVTRRVDIDENGKELWSKEKQTVRNELVNKAKDAMNEQRLEKLKNEGTAITDDNGNIIGYEMSHRNALGQKVTITATKNDDGTFTLNKAKNSVRMEMLAKMTKEGSKLNTFAKNNAVFKQKNLSAHNEARKTIISDQFMSVRQIKDSSGKVIQQDIAFNDKFTKYMVAKDGTLNMDMINKLKANSQFDEKTINTAIALHVMKSRGISIGSKFTDRQVSIDKNGALHLVQTNSDGSVTELTTMIGGKNGNQMMSEIKNTATDGSYTVIADNGIMRRRINYTQGQKEATVSYQFADEYYRRHKYISPLSSDGYFAKGMDQDAAMFGFNEVDLQTHARQIATGKAQAVDAEYRSIFANPNENN